MQHPIIDLPSEGYVRWPTIKRVTGVASRSTIWRMEKRGAFPASVRITPRLTAWDAREVREWIASPTTWTRRQQA